MMTTFYIRTTYPVPLENLQRFEAYHMMHIGNSLSVIPNVAETECLVKINSDYPIQQIINTDILIIDIIEETFNVLPLLQTPEWLRSFP